MEAASSSALVVTYVLELGLNGAICPHTDELDAHWVLCFVERHYGQSKAISVFGAIYTETHQSKCHLKVTTEVGYN